MTHDEFLQSEFDKIKQPNEQIVGTALGWFGPGVWAQVLLLGGLLSFLLMKFRFAILTNQRLILIRTKSGLIRIKKENHGVESIAADQLQSVDLKGKMMQKRLVMKGNAGGVRVFRLNTVAPQVTGQKQFPELAVAELNRQIEVGVTGVGSGVTTPATIASLSEPIEAAPMRWVFWIPVALSVVVFGAVVAMGGGEDDLVSATYLAVPLAAAGIAGRFFSKRTPSLGKSGLLAGLCGIGAVLPLFTFYAAIWPML